MKTYLGVVAVFISLLITQPSKSQTISIGSWKSHLANRWVKIIVEADNRIYCSNGNGLFYYDKTDNSLGQLNKVDGLTDVNIAALAYSNETKTLIIAYQNANIDLVLDNTIYNLPEIKNKLIPADKRINNIFCQNNNAYLSTGFGVVVINLKKREILSTYIIGNNGTYLGINDLTIDNDFIYAATNAGLYYAPAQSNQLEDYHVWQIDTTIPVHVKQFNLIEKFGNRIFLNKPDAGWQTDTILYKENNVWTQYIFRNNETRNFKANANHFVITNHYYVQLFDAQFNETIYYSKSNNKDTLFELYDGMTDKDEILWWADRNHGLVRCDKLDFFDFKYFIPNGPATNNIFKLHVQDRVVWISPGAYDDGSMVYVDNKDPISQYNMEKWNYYDVLQADTMWNVVCIATDPNDSAHYFVGGFILGRIAEYKSGKKIKEYNYKEYNVERPTRMKYDEDGNLWVSCMDNVVRIDRAGAVTNYPVKLHYPQSIHVFSNDINFDESGNIWILAPRENEFLVYSADNQVKHVSRKYQEGNLPDAVPTCAVMDLKGELWIGTTKGIAVIYNPENIFSGGDYDAQRITITLDGHAQYLLESEKVTAIAVDGANRKWIGTQNSGLYLFSEDGMDLIEHFTISNSPLFDNNITALGIDDITGEIYIGTASGLISYRSNATRAAEKFVEEEVFAFPNPVRENYSGTIAVKGLVEDTHIKITDIAGNMVFETKALGGQAVWDGKNLMGKRPASGVYLVWLTNKDGSEKMVTKILLM